jgi:hypothetical protein
VVLKGNCLRVLIRQCKGSWRESDREDEGTPCFRRYIHKNRSNRYNGEKAALKVDGEPVKIDPLLLFQTLVTAAIGSVPEEDLGRVFSQELCTYSPSLYESPYSLREADNPSLADAIKANVNPDSKLPDDQLKYVVDGCRLLQWLPWRRGRGYRQICEMYLAFVKSKYGLATVVFDSYEGGHSTKDNTHQRRTGGHIGTEVIFSETMLMHGKKVTFIANMKNKHRFINLLSEKHQAAGVETLHASNRSPHSANSCKVLFNKGNSIGW